MKTMKWLLRREFWEHKGAMMWAPLVAAAPRIKPGVVRRAGWLLASAAYTVAQNVAAAWCVR